MEDRGMLAVATAMIPLAEMFGYATTLHSMTEATWNVYDDPAEYVAVPANVAATIIEARGSKCVKVEKQNPPYGGFCL